MKPSRSTLEVRAAVRVTFLVLLSLLPALGATEQVDGNDPTLGPVARIDAVRYHVEPGQTRVWFETGGAVLYTHYSPDPLTLVIDLPGVDISSLAERTVVGSREVESILATSLEGIKGRRLSRIEVKLATIVPYQLSGTEHALNILFDGSSGPGSESTSPETMMDSASRTPVADRPAPPAVQTSSAGASSESSERATIPRQEPPPPARAPAPAQVPAYSGPPATAISAVTHSLIGDILEVTVHADGRLNYTSFRLDGPSRLVFDFNGVLNGVPRAAVSVEEMGVSRIRIAQFRNAEPRITRLVFDLNNEVSHRALEADAGLRISFARSEETLAPAYAALDTGEYSGDNGGFDTPSEPEQAGSDGASELSTVTIGSDGLVEATTQPFSYSPDAPIESVGARLAGVQSFRDQPGRARASLASAGAGLHDCR